MNIYVDPYTKQQLHQCENGDLLCEDGKDRIVYPDYDGTYDFVHPRLNLAEERDYYDSQYSTQRMESLKLSQVRAPWYNSIMPEHHLLLESMGDLTGKKVLLLGNGTSFKELFFTQLGADVVYTDLSIEAVKQIKGWFLHSEFACSGRGSIEFHAVDALHLPFPDDTFDIIYGCAFVHHIEDLDSFLLEIKRCLKTGGKCRFLDDAYSPLWQWMKRLPLKALQAYSHRKGGISPEDQRATERGGYTIEEIEQVMARTGFTEMMFIRVSFFLRLFRRGSGKLFGYSRRTFRLTRPFMIVLRGTDTLLGKIWPMKNNLINLVWGFTK